MKSGHLPSVFVVGGGELGSAVCHRLHRSGMEVLLSDQEHPTCVRRGVCFAMALSTGSKTIEGVTAQRASSIDRALEIMRGGDIPVLAGEFTTFVSHLPVQVLVDARMLKRNDRVSTDLASLVVGLGPGFAAGRDVHAVVETNRGNNLGSVIWTGCAQPDTGTPAEVGGFKQERVIRSPASGIFVSQATIGQIVAKDQRVGTVGSDTPVPAPIAGLLRGIVMDGLGVTAGQKIGDVDPRGEAINPNAISDKGRAVAGGVLEAIMYWWTRGGDV